MKFRLSSFMVFSVIVGVLLSILADYFGYTNPSYQVRTITRIIESLTDPVSYDNFLMQTALPDGIEMPPMSDHLHATYQWELKHGYKLLARFDCRDENLLEQACIYAENRTGPPYFRYAWTWDRFGDTGSLDDFFKP